MKQLPFIKGRIEAFARKENNKDMLNRNKRNRSVINGNLRKFKFGAPET
jgi:hypothetical protein